MEIRLPNYSIFGVVETMFGGWSCTKQQMAIVADRFPMVKVLAALEDAMASQLRVGACLETLA